LVKRRFGASGNSGDDGTIVCCFSRKKSRNDCRISAEVMVLLLKVLEHRECSKWNIRSFASSSPIAFPEPIESSRILMTNRPLSSNRFEAGFLILGWLLIAILAIALSKQNLSTPGLYYDEAVSGGLAKDFVSAHSQPHMSNVRVCNVYGRPFPLFVQSYYGALKSWLFIPPVALCGATLAVLRLTSLACALVALLFFLLAVRLWLGLPAAIIAGAVFVTDPNFFFLSLLDWGPAIPPLLCRCAAFYFALSWWRTRKAGHLLLAGFFLGLGLFHKADFVVFLAGTGVAVACFYGMQLFLVLRARPSLIAMCALGFLLGAGPMLWRLPQIVASNAPRQVGFGEFKEKLQTWAALYDGSYIERLMSSGGLFGEMYKHSSNAHSLLWLVLPFAMVLLLVICFFPQSSKERRVGGFLLLGFVLTTAGVFVMPGAVRIHHAVLAYPFPQLIIAAACTFLWQRKSSRIMQRGSQVAIFFALLILLASQMQAIRKTEQLLSETGGRGWWSNALDDFCRQNAERADLTIVSLDWGFNEQLAFLTNGPKLLEPFWTFASFKDALPALPRDPQYVYLAHSPEYSLLRYDLLYLDAARSDDHAEIQQHSDKQGQIVFYTIRFREQ
jgi:4-amino-4-deoxy-L-arabinose transferase-like glycosyltransferase